MESRFEELESNVLGAIESNYSPCRFGTEERTEIFEEIHEQIEDCTLGMKFDCEEKLKEVELDAERALEELQEEVKETLEQLEESVEENTERLVQQGLRTKLENASLRFDGTVFLDT
jgi:gas vesicle protein